MKALVSLTAFLILFVSLASHAQIKLPSYSSLCAYEPACGKVGKIKNRKLVPKPPKPELIEYYRKLRNTVIRIANQYDVDPVTLVLTPLAENTMNVNIDDELQDALVSSGNAPEGVFLGVEMSVGPGQIYTSAAKRVEELAAEIEGRKVRTKKEIAQALLTPEGALRYAAAIIRQAQDVYAEAGYDISQRPEILATLYNIGRPDRRVKETLRAKREPYPNYFGYFVGIHYESVRAQLNLPSVFDK